MYIYICVFQRSTEGSSLLANQNSKTSGDGMRPQTDDQTRRKARAGPKGPQAESLEATGRGGQEAHRPQDNARMARPTKRRAGRKGGKATQRRTDPPNRQNE